MIGIFFLVLLLILAIAIASAIYIAKATAKKLKQQNNRYAEGWVVLVFLVSFLIIGGGIFLLVIWNIPFGR